MGRNPNNKSSRSLLSVEEASVLLGVTRSTLYRAIKAGTFPLPVFRIGQRTRIPRRSVDRLLAGLPPSPEEEPSLADTSLSQATDTHPTDAQPVSSPVLGSSLDGESRLPT
jgi:excisionase family DNA binding protein